MENTGRMLSSLIQTRSIERVLAPIAAQVSQLILLNDASEREGGKLPNLVPFAQSVLRATEDLVQVGQKLSTDSADEILQRDMPQACEEMGMSGHSVLMTVQRLQADPSCVVSRHHMVAAAKKLLQTTMKCQVPAVETLMAIHKDMVSTLRDDAPSFATLLNTSEKEIESLADDPTTWRLSTASTKENVDIVLLVSDDAEVRRIIRAAHWVLDRLQLVKSVQSMNALVSSFKGFTESVMLLSSLCDRRQQDLTQMPKKEQIHNALSTLKKALPSLSTSMQMYVKYPHNMQAQASRDYTLRQVSGAVEDIMHAIQKTPGATQDTTDRDVPGHFAIRIQKIIELLSPNQRFSLDPDFDCLLEGVVRHSMTVATVSREKVREEIVNSSKQILKSRNIILNQSQSVQDNPTFKQLRADYEESCEDLAKELIQLERLILKSRNIILNQSQSVQDNPTFKQLRADYEESCEDLAKELIQLERLVRQAVLYQCIDVFVLTTEPMERMVKAATVRLKEKDPLSEKTCMRILQPLDDALQDHLDRMCQLGSFMAASSTNYKRVRAILSSVNALENVDPEVLPACIAVRQDNYDKGAIEHLKLIHKEWCNEVQRLVESIDDLVDVNRFMELSETSMESDAEESKQAINMLDAMLLGEAANRLIGRAKRVLHVASKQVDNSDQPIYRNGLQVHTNSLKHAITLVKNGAHNAVTNIRHKKAKEQLGERCEELLDCVHDVSLAIRGENHPDILSPSRENVRKGSRTKAQDFQDYEASEARQTELENSYLNNQPTYPLNGGSFLDYVSPLELDESYLSKPTADSSRLLPSGKTRVNLSAPSQKKEVPVKLVHPIDQLMRAVFTEDWAMLDRRCQEVSCKTQFLVDLALRAAECVEKQQCKGNLASKASFLQQSVASLLDKASACSTAVGNIPKAETQILAEEWTLAACQVTETVKETIGVWSMPGSNIVAAAASGNTAILPKQVDTLHLHKQNIHRLAAAVVEALGGNSGSETCPRKVDGANQVQQVVGNWTKLLQELIGFAHKAAIDTDDAVLQDILESRMLDCSVKQLELLRVIDSVAIEQARMAANLTAVAVARNKERISERVREVKDFGTRMVDMADKVLIGCKDSIKIESVAKQADIVNKLTGSFTNVAISIADEGGSHRVPANVVLSQRLGLLQREWSANVHILGCTLDELIGDSVLPLDRLNGAALAVSQAKGQSRRLLLEDFQNHADNLCIRVTHARQSCTNALSSVQMHPLKKIAMSCIDCVCRATPLLVAEARNLADNLDVKEDHLVDLKRQWACYSMAVMACLTEIPEADSTALADVVSALSMKPGTFKSTPGASQPHLQGAPWQGIYPQHLKSIGTLPTPQIQTQGPTVMPQNTTLAPLMKNPPMEPTATSTPVKPICDPHSQSSSHLPPSRGRGHNQSFLTGRDLMELSRISPTKRSPNDSGQGMNGPYRSKPLGLTEYPRSHGLKYPQSASSVGVTSATPGISIGTGFGLATTCPSPIAAAALALQQETDKWEDENNAIVKVAKTMATQMYAMSRYSRRTASAQCKEELINSAKAIAANGKAIHRFAQIIAKNCLDTRFCHDLKAEADQIPILSTQLSIVASVKAATPDDVSADIVLVTNAGNLMQAITSTLKAAEAACVRGLKSSEEGEDSDEAEASALAAQWRRKLHRHRLIESVNPDTDHLGLRRVNRDTSAPTLMEIVSMS